MIRLCDPDLEVQKSDGALTMKYRRPAGFKAMVLLGTGTFATLLVGAAFDPMPNNFPFEPLVIRLLLFAGAAALLKGMVGFVFGRVTFSATPTKLSTDFGPFRRRPRQDFTTAHVDQFFISHVKADSIAPSASICLHRLDGSVQLIGEDLITAGAAFQIIAELNSFYGLRPSPIEGIPNQIDRSLARDDFEMDGSISRPQLKAISVYGGLGFSCAWTKRFAYLYFIAAAGFATPIVTSLMVPGMRQPDTAFWVFTSAVVIALLWIGFATVLDKTRLVATGQQFTVKQGPIPLPWKRSWTFDRSQILQFWVGPSGSKLFLIDNSGRPFPLMERLGTKAQLETVAAQLNAFYAVSPQPVTTFAMDLGKAEPLPLTLSGATVSDGQFNFGLSADLFMVGLSASIFVAFLLFIIVAMSMDTPRPPLGSFAFLIGIFCLLGILLIYASPIRTKFLGSMSELTVTKILMFGKRTTKKFLVGPGDYFAGGPIKNGFVVRKLSKGERVWISQVKSADVAYALASALNEFFATDHGVAAPHDAEQDGAIASAPLNVAIERSDVQVSFRIKSKNQIAVLEIIYGLMFTILTAIGVVKANYWPEVILMGALFAFFLLLVLVGIANLVNHTEIRATRGKITLTRGPFPWKMVKTIPIGKIREWVAQPNSEVCAQFTAAVGYRSDDFGFKAIASSLPTKADAVAIATALNEFYSLPADRKAAQAPSRYDSPN